MLQKEKAAWLLRIANTCRKLFVAFILVLCAGSAMAQKPKNGTYTFKIAYWEWGGKPRDGTCNILIHGDSITVIHNGDPSISGNKGDKIDEGIILLHKKTGKWIIGHKLQDKYASKVGGCAEGPTVIDFKRRMVWLC